MKANSISQKDVSKIFLTVTNFIYFYLLIFFSLSYFQTVLSCMLLGAILPIMTQAVKLHHLTITAISLSSALCSLICILIARNPEILHLAAVIRSFAEMTTTSIRSAITKIVGNQDVGKVIEVSII